MTENKYYRCFECKDIIEAITNCDYDELSWELDGTYIQCDYCDNFCCLKEECQNKWFIVYDYGLARCSECESECERYQKSKEEKQEKKEQEKANLLYQKLQHNVYLDLDLEKKG